MSTIFMSQIKCPRQRQQAFSLIELMIAMAIGLFLLLGLGIVFVSVSQTASVQSQLAQLQDNERMAMTLLTDIVQEAGYFDNPGPNQTTLQSLQAQTVSTSTGSVNFNAGQALFGTYSSSAPGDSISIRFSTATQNLVNCQGAPNTTGTTQVVTNTFFVLVDTTNNVSSLACSVNGGAGQALVSGVSSINIQYGVDSNRTGSVDTYLYADKMSSAQWVAVRSVVVTVTFINPLYKPGQNDNQPQTIPLTRVIKVTNPI